MSVATANQLRLIRDAVARMETSDIASKEAVSILLSELIGIEALSSPRGGPAAEADQLRALDAFALAERAPRSKEAAADAIDRKALGAFLNNAIEGEGDIVVANAQTISRGMSKKTVLVTLEGARVLPAELALRIDRGANNYLGTTVSDEWGPLQLLWRGGARIPQPFILESTGAVIGDRFIAFARASGVPVGSIYFPPGPNPGLIADTALCMAKIHAIPVNDWPNKDHLQGDAFFDAQYAGYLSDWGALQESSAIMDAGFEWIERRKARAYGPPALTHDDFNYNNILVENDRVTAVLDWEFAHVGTPAADVAYLWYAAESASTFAAFLDAYEAAGGIRPPADQLDFYVMWGQLRLAVMGHKAVRNLEEGHFDDVRYGMSRWHRRRGLLRLADLLERFRD